MFEKPDPSDYTLKRLPMEPVTKTKLSYRGRLVPMIWLEEIDGSDEVYVHLESPHSAGRCAGPVSQQSVETWVPILCDAMAVIGGYNCFGGEKANLFDQVVHSLGGHLGGHE